MQKNCHILSSIVFFLCFALFSQSVAADSLPTLTTLWKASAPPKPLKAWSFSELKALKSASSREKDSQSGKMLFRKGPLLSRVVEKTIETLPSDLKAQVDLIILKNKRGEQAQIPRWLITRYPLLLSVEKGTIQVVIPWSSRSKIWDEGLPLNRYQLQDVVQIEFASYHDVYGAFYLKRRMDPVALRGEKIFVQNCTSCHSTGIEKSARKIASAGHPKIENHAQDTPRLKDREMRALFSYLDAYQSENPASGASFSRK